MSDDPRTIDRAPPAEPGADYATLRARAIELTRAMAPQWTDYNYSDPGVTILEQLCYALTELPYRASMPVEEMLVAPGDGRVHLERQGLKPAWSILPCNPVTRNDITRLLLDRVPQAANIWLTPADRKQHRGLSGIYDIAILPLASDRSSDGGFHHHESVVERVKRCFRAHRSLCEDVGAVRVLSPIDWRIDAAVQLCDGVDASDTLARILFQLGLALAPEPKRQSLAEQIARTGSSAAAFAGPLMVRGFIADDQLGPQPTAVEIDWLAQKFAETPGVLSVGRFEVEVDGRGRFGRGQTIAVPDDGILWLRATDAEQKFTIVFRRGHRLVRPNPVRVRRILAQLWRAQRQTYSLRSDYRARFGAPRGVYRDLSVYSSIQRQFPDLYGINANGLPREASPMRRAQALQLKGYLMPFEQMFADYFAQIGFVRDLFSIEAGGDASYAYQSLRPIVPGVAPLLGQGYETGLAAISAAPETLDTRQNQILDFLLSLYARTPNALLQAMATAETKGEQRLAITAKQTILRHVAGIGSDRGRGADYGRRRSARAISGVERHSRLQLGLLDSVVEGDHHPISEDAAEDDDFGIPLPDELGATLDRLFFRVEALEEAILAEEASPALGRRIAAPLAAALGDPARYRIGRDDEGGSVYILCIDIDGNWWWLSKHEDEAAALAIIRRLLRDFGEPARHRERRATLRVVDWIFLRAAMAADERPASRFNFRITAVLSADYAGHEDADWQQQAQKIIRANTPAHVMLDCLFLSWHAMHRFERLYSDWEEALRGGGARRLTHTCTRLEHFLTRELIDAGIEVEPHPTPPPSSPGSFASMPPPTPAPTPIPIPPSGTPPIPDRPPAPPPTPTPLPPVTPEADPDPDAVYDPHPLRHALAWLWKTLLWPILKIFALLGLPRALRAMPPPAPATPIAPSAPPQSTIPSPTPPQQPTRLSGQVERSSASAQGFDTDTALTPRTAAAFARAGFGFAIRYLPLTSTAGAGDISNTEAGAILDAGLALMAVQHPMDPGWTPSASLGASYGQCAASHAWAIGLPPGMTIWLDLEGVATDAPAATIQDYCAAWYAQLAAYGYVSGLYVGDDCGLSASQIVDTGFPYFWRSGSSVPSLPAGYCMTQSISSGYAIDGVAYDLDVIQADAAGDTPPWLSRA